MKHGFIPNSFYSHQEYKGKKAALKFPFVILSVLEALFLKWIEFPAENREL